MERKREMRKFRGVWQRGGKPVGRESLLRSVKLGMGITSNTVINFKPVPS